MHAGWKTIPLWEFVNRENMVNGEAGIIRLFMDLNLPYHACINEKAGGGGASTKRSKPEGVRFGVYLCLNNRGTEPFAINTERLLSRFRGPLRKSENALATSSFFINKEHIGNLQFLVGTLQALSESGVLAMVRMGRGIWNTCRRGKPQ